MQKEVNKRIAECMATLKKLDPYWLKGDGSVKQKIIVFDAVIRANLMYGLESFACRALPHHWFDECELTLIRVA